MEEEDVFEPHVDIHALFVHYSTTYFNDSLGAASVEWSSRRMTSCGGVCEYTRGGGCRIKLSEPLLKVRQGSMLSHSGVIRWSTALSLEEPADRAHCTAVANACLC